VIKEVSQVRFVSQLYFTSNSIGNNLIVVYYLMLIHILHVE